MLEIVELLRAAEERARRRRQVVTLHGFRYGGNVVPEDRGLELPELLARLEAQILIQKLPRTAIRVERVNLATGAIEREHQVMPQALAVRMLPDEEFELVDQLRAAAQSEPRSDEPLA